MRGLPHASDYGTRGHYNQASCTKNSKRYKYASQVTVASQPPKRFAAAAFATRLIVFPPPLSEESHLNRNRPVAMPSIYLATRYYTRPTLTLRPCGVAHSDNSAVRCLGTTRPQQDVCIDDSLSALFLSGLCSFGRDMAKDTQLPQQLERGPAFGPLSTRRDQTETTKLEDGGVDGPRPSLFETK